MDLPSTVPAGEFHRKGPATAQRLASENNEAQRQPDLGFAQPLGIALPIEGNFAAQVISPGNPFGLTDINLPGRATARAEGQPEQGQPTNKLGDTARHQGVRFLAHLVVDIFAYKLEPIGDRADRPNQIVTQTGAKKRGEFDGIHGRAFYKFATSNVTCFRQDVQNSALPIPPFCDYCIGTHMTTLPELESLREPLRQLVLDAGHRILEIYDEPLEVRQKDDSSPVTEADEEGERIILAGLAPLTPDIPVVAEESAAAGQIPDVSGGTFWLVDPLDGTKEFISRNGEFTVNIALIHDGRPVLGVVYAPAVGRLFIGLDGRAFAETKPEGGDWGPAKPISVRQPPAEGLTVVASRSHRDAQTEAFIETIDVAEIKSAGSSLKLCLVAAGEADIYPRFGPTMEWDIAAGHAVLAAAGGTLLTSDGEPFAYAKPEFRNPGFIAYGGGQP